MTCDSRILLANPRKKSQNAVGVLGDFRRVVVPAAQVTAPLGKRQPDATTPNRYYCDSGEKAGGRSRIPKTSSGVLQQHGGYAPMEEWDDNFTSLIRRVREGSEDAAWELVDQYGEAIRRAVRRALNERLRSKFDSLDFVQIVWNSLFRVRDKLDRFDRPEELTAYLVTMARNKVGMEVRRRLMTREIQRGARGIVGSTSGQGRPGHSQPAACAHRRGHRPRTMGPLARRPAAALPADHPVAVAGAYLPEHRRRRPPG